MVALGDYFQKRELQRLLVERLMRHFPDGQPLRLGGFAVTIRQDNGGARWTIRDELDSGGLVSERHCQTVADAQAGAAIVLLDCAISRGIPLDALDAVLRRPPTARPTR